MVAVGDGVAEADDVTEDETAELGGAVPVALEWDPPPQAATTAAVTTIRPTSNPRMRNVYQIGTHDRLRVVTSCGQPRPKVAAYHPSGGS